MYHPPQFGECPPQLHSNFTSLITLQSGFEWFEFYGESRVVPILQVASVFSVCFWLFRDVSSFYFQKQKCSITPSRCKRILTCLEFALRCLPLLQGASMSQSFGFLWLF